MMRSQTRLSYQMMSRRMMKMMTRKHYLRWELPSSSSPFVLASTSASTPLFLFAFLQARWFNSQTISPFYLLIMHFLHSILCIVIVFKFLLLNSLYNEGIGTFELDANNLAILPKEPFEIIFSGWFSITFHINLRVSWPWHSTYQNQL